MVVVPFCATLNLNNNNLSTVLSLKSSLIPFDFVCFASAVLCKVHDLLGLLRKQHKPAVVWIYYVVTFNMLFRAYVHVHTEKIQCD